MQLKLGYKSRSMKWEWVLILKCKVLKLNMLICKNTLANIQSQHSNMSKGRSNVEGDSILGDPMSMNNQGGNYTRPQQNIVEKWSAWKNDNYQENRLGNLCLKLIFLSLMGLILDLGSLKSNHYFKMVPGCLILTGFIWLVWIWRERVLNGIKIRIWEMCVEWR